MQGQPRDIAERRASARRLAEIAARGERDPALWLGYFERLLSGETIGPLPRDHGDGPTAGHAISGQYAFRLAPQAGEIPTVASPSLRHFQGRLAGLDQQQAAVGIDLSAVPETHFRSWIEALSRELETRRESGRAVTANFSLSADHGGWNTLLAAVRGNPSPAFRVTLRVGPEAFGSGAQWQELVDASHGNPRIELVFAGDSRPLTELMGTEKPDTVMPLSLFEAPAETAWLGMQFDLSAIPAEQIERGTGHLKKLVRVGVRLADNLIDSVTWPSKSLREDAFSNRRLAAHVTGIGDLVLRHRMDPEASSTLALVERWLRLFKRQLLRESLRLAQERGPYPALNAQRLVEALVPQYGQARARRIIAHRSPRHRQLLALSPYCVLPRRPTPVPPRAWLNLLPLIRIADNVTMYGSAVRSMLDRADYERLLRSTWALLHDSHGA